jgi:AcrR family transcriptional regulator
MARWDPDAGGRLQQAAMTLYLERGYDAVTVAEIAERAGLTKRTFFRHFADKREVLFAGAETFNATVVDALAAAPGDLPPIDAAVLAVARASLQLVEYAPYARARRDLVRSSADLQERELIKTATLTASVAEGLRRRGVEPLTATLAAQAAAAVFTTAHDRWVDGDVREDLPALLRRTLDDLRRAISAG